MHSDLAISIGRLALGRLLGYLLAKINRESRPPFFGVFCLRPGHPRFRSITNFLYLHLAKNDSSATRISGPVRCRWKEPCRSFNTSASSGLPPAIEDRSNHAIAWPASPALGHSARQEQSSPASQSAGPRGLRHWDAPQFSR
jgi:hypothetical protein